MDCNLQAGKSILVVEDEQLVAESVASWLQVLGYQTTAAVTGLQALDAARSVPVDLILMDIQLREGMDGVATARLIREFTSAPIVFLTGLSDRETIERVAGAGASGFILKPFSLDQLAVTVELALCGKSEPATASVLRVQDLEIDTARHRVSRSGLEIRLTKKEFQILACLAEARGATLSPESILAKAWGHQYVHYIQTVRVHVANLRQKIEPSPAAPRYIETVPGVGYRAVESSAQSQG
ncbi:MAG TPA: response regulator transcription factor [Bryobacteraceae bacterium]|nr:response regulator transcription factor [Bryobacteraceae bacterium]